MSRPTKILVALGLLDQFEVIEHPGLFDIAFKRAIEAEDHEEAFLGIGLDPVPGLSFRCYFFESVDEASAFSSPSSAFTRRCSNAAMRVS